MPMAVEAQMYSGFVLGGSCQDLMTENACGMNDPRIQTRNMEFNHHSLMGFSQIDNQRAEIDLFVNSHNERLRRALLEQRRHQICTFLKNHESRVQFMMKQKDEQIAAAARRTLELQDFLTKMEAERQTWQRLARENEAMVATLSSTVERMKGAAAVAAAHSPADAEDAESCCCAEGGEEERDMLDHETRKMVCRNCRRRNSCVIMLPCRHLSSCTDCEPLLQFCPVCNVMKKASLEAVFV